MTVTLMSRWQRVKAALTGDEVDCPPVSLWAHFPKRDQTAEALTDATIAWQSRYDFDFIKLMPPGDYATIDWGAESAYRGNAIGTRETTRFPISDSDDWRRISKVPVDRGMNREVIEAVRLVKERVGEDIHVLQTIFSPLTVAMKLSNGAVLDHLRQTPERVHQALSVIADVTRQVLTASLERGASGIFFATQSATADFVTVEEYREFGTRYDLAVLKEANTACFNLLHLHGKNIMFDELMGYPVHALNWHDQHTPPTLAEGKARSGRCVAGGIDENAVATMLPEQAAQQGCDAIASLSGRHMMVAPGCVIPLATTEASIQAVIDAVRGKA